MQRAASFEKTLMLGKIEGRRRRGWQGMRWLDGITYSMDMGLGGLRKIVMARKAWRAVIHGVTKSRTRLSDWTELNTQSVFQFLRSEVQMYHSRPLEVSFPKGSKVKFCTHSGDSREESLFTFSSFQKQSAFFGFFFIFDVNMSIFKFLSKSASMVMSPFLPSVQSLSRVWLFVTPWITARQASLSITNSRSSLRLTSIETQVRW